MAPRRAPTREAPATPPAPAPPAVTATPSAPATPAVTVAAVTVVQIDTRDAFEDMHGPVRTWPGGPTHDQQRQAYDRANPEPPERSFVGVTCLVNAWHCRCRDWRYRCVRATPVPDRHPSWVKLRWILDAWDALPDGTWTVVLDTDAWVRDPAGLAAVLAGTHATFVGVADPPCAEGEAHRAGDLNGGFLAFKKDPRVRHMIQRAWDLADDQSGPDGSGAVRYRQEWPWEQACMCMALREADARTGAEAGPEAGPEWVQVLPVEACNTPAGTYVAHCWYKDLAAKLAIDDLLSSMAVELVGCRRPTCEFVVARYDEDVSWLRRWLPFADRITIYDKSDAPVASFDPKVTVVPLPNVGREAHTYAHHFAARYDDLCDAVVCTQGALDDHLKPEQFEAMVRTRTRPANTGLDMAWSQCPMSRFGWTEAANWDTVRRQPMTPMGMTMGKFFLTHVADDLVPESAVEWWPGAVFVVPATAVRRQPQERYARLRDFLARGGPNPEAAHAMERCWKALFVEG